MSKLKRAKSLVGKTIKFKDEVMYHSDTMLVTGLRFANEDDYYEKKIILVTVRHHNKLGDEKDEVEYTDRRFEIVHG